MDYPNPCSLFGHFGRILYRSCLLYSPSRHLLELLQSNVSNLPFSRYFKYCHLSLFLPLCLPFRMCEWHFFHFDNAVYLLSFPCCHLHEPLHYHSCHCWCTVLRGAGMQSACPVSSFVYPSLYPSIYPPKISSSLLCISAAITRLLQVLLFRFLVCLPLLFRCRTCRKNLPLNGSSVMVQLEGSMKGMRKDERGNERKDGTHMVCLSGTPVVSNLLFLLIHVCVCLWKRQMKEGKGRGIGIRLILSQEFELRSLGSLSFSLCKGLWKALRCSRWDREEEIFEVVSYSLTTTTETEKYNWNPCLSVSFILFFHSILPFFLSFCVWIAFLSLLLFSLKWETQRAERAEKMSIERAAVSEVHTHGVSEKE